MKTLGDLVERNARFFADDVCLVYGERRFTNREHIERALRLAAALHEAGCRRQPASYSAAASRRARSMCSRLVNRRSP